MQTKKIAFDGTSLKSLLEYSEEKFRQEGSYYGIKELELSNSDPIKFEIFYSRLVSGAITARETARHVAASPVTREVAELCTVLLTPEGDSVAYSTGIVVHTQCMGRVIKWMIKNDYEDDPGIAPGDIFECNDMLLGGVHIPDIYTFSPIFHADKLVGWIGSVTHEPDVGAITGGCVPAMAVDRFAEGMKLCAEKIGNNDTIGKEYIVKVNGSVRMPHVWLLDAKSRATCSITYRETVLRIIEEFGIDYYMKAVRELIEEERLTQLQRMKNRLIPGRYRETGFLDIMQTELPTLPWAKKDWILAHPIELVIDAGGLLTIDASGGSSFDYHSFNVPKGAMEGGLSVSLCQMFAYDGRINCGFMLATDFVLPEGLWCNPVGQYFSTANSWNPLMLFLELLRKCLSQGFFSRGYREEVMTSGGGISFVEFGGKNQFGQVFGGPIPEAASGGGAKAISDGLDTGHVFWNTEADIGNAEVWELIYPVIFLGRNSLPDSGGYGRFRGGNGHESYYMIWGSNEVYASEIPMTPFSRVLHNGGLYGGYPGSRFFDFIAKDTDLSERIKNKLPLPHKEGDPKNPEVMQYLKGDVQEVSHFHLTPYLHDYDLIAHKVISGCGGYGDPLERSPEMVLKDLENGMTDVGIVRNIYGVSANYDEASNTWKLDLEQTTALRHELKNKRKAKGIPVREWWKKSRAAVIKDDFDPLVQNLLKDSIAKSPKFAEEYRRFWSLADPIPEVK